jgi:hypothetical protein
MKQSEKDPDLYNEQDLDEWWNYISYDEKREVYFAYIEFLESLREDRDKQINGE